MIKLFRKIRFDLLKQNKTSKYFKYALGEVILVVIGILIALQINNWNEKRKAQLNEKVLVLKLLEDLEEDARVLAIISDRIDLKRKLNYDLYRIGMGELSVDSINNASALRIGMVFISAVKSNASELASTLSNDEIRDQLLSYFNRLNSFEVNIEIFRRLLQNNIRPYLVENNLLNTHGRVLDSIVLYSSLNNEKLIEHAPNQNFQQLLYDMSIKVQSIQVTLQRLQNDNKSLKEIINNELKDYYD